MTEVWISLEYIRSFSVTPADSEIIALSPDSETDETKIVSFAIQ